MEDQEENKEDQQQDQEQQKLEEKQEEKQGEQQDQEQVQKQEEENQQQNSNSKNSIPNQNQDNTMDQNYEEDNNNNYNNNNSSMAVQNEKSLWVAKKAHHDTDKNINLLMNRLALLKKEEERSQKKIQDVRTKTRKILETKQKTEEMNKKKNFNKNHDNEFLSLMQKKSNELRKQQEEERAAIREAMQEQKREEYYQIKKQQQENVKKITLAKQKIMEQNKKKHDKIYSHNDNSKKIIETYWQHRLKYFEDQQEQERYENIKLKENKDKLLEQLEDQEAEIIKRLKYSQIVHEKACNELDEVIQIPASQFIKKSQKGSMSALIQKEQVK